MLKFEGGILYATAIKHIYIYVYGQEFYIVADKGPQVCHPSMPIRTCQRQIIKFFNTLYVPKRLLLMNTTPPTINKPSHS